MNDHDDPRHELADRLMDLAIGEVVGERRPPDLTARIVAAAAAPRHPARPRRLLALAACMVIAVGLAASGFVGYLLGRSRSVEQTAAVAKAGAPGRTARLPAPPTKATPPDPSPDRATERSNAPAEIDPRLAALVDRFNAAVKENRYSDAEAVSQQATEQFPDELVTMQLKSIMKMVARTTARSSSAETPSSDGESALEKEFQKIVRGSASANDIFEAHSFFEDLYDPDAAGTAYQFGSVEAWQRLADRRRSARGRPRSSIVGRQRHKGAVDPGLAEQLAIIPDVDAAALGYPTAEEWQLLAERRRKVKSAEQASGATDQDRVRAALEEKTTISFTNRPLNELLEYLSARHDVKIRLDEEAHDERAQRIEKAITIDIAGISLRAALRRLLADLHLDYIIEGGAIVLTSKSRAAQSRQADADMAQRLRTPVRPDFKNLPLADALARLAKKAGVVIRLDEPALAQQGVDPSVPITVDLTREISLKSSLVLILSPLDLDFDIEQGGITIRGKRPEQEAIADGDRYPHIIENPYREAFEYPLSTFSIDVDTASYAKVRRYILQEHRLPPPDAVRIEELVNYFDYSDAPPGEDVAAEDATAPVNAAPFAAHIELAACPWQPEHRLARIGIQGRRMPESQRPAANLVFLIDVSGSMKPDDRLPRVCRAMKLLVERLRENDRVAIVAYAADPKLVLASTGGAEKDRIRLALDELQANGSTNGADGLRLAYDTAQEHFSKDGINRVVLCTDGDFNVGLTSRDGLERLIVERAKTGVYLTVLGFGQGNHNDELLETLADKGNGNYGYIDSEDEARKLLVEQAGGTLQTIAQDVKLQIEFNPRHVAAYRLLGYEDRLLASEDFNDDAKDAGEIGSGHSVTALYELVPAGPGVKAQELNLKYQRPAALSEAAAGDEWLTLSLRYKLPGNESSQPPIVVVGRDDDHTIAQSSADLRFAAAVAGFGLLLRNSAYRGDLAYDALVEIATGALGDDPNGRRAGFIELVREVQRLAEKNSARAVVPVR